MKFCISYKNRQSVIKQHKICSFFKKLNKKADHFNIHTKDNVFLYFFIHSSLFTLFSLVLVSSSCSSSALRLFEAALPQSPHPSPYLKGPGFVSRCQGLWESPPLESAQVDHTLCSAGLRCHFGCLPSAEAGNQRILEGPGFDQRDTEKLIQKFRFLAYLWI